MWPRPAPSAVRTATSRRRTSARASCRLATFAQAISSTNATDPNRINSEPRTWPVMNSCAGITRRASPPRLPSGLRAHVAGLHPSRRDDGELARRRRRRHVVLQSREARIRAAAPGAEVGGIDDFGHPRFRRPQRRVVVRQAERRRHHADDRARAAVDLNRSADDVGGAAEAPLPQAVTDHDHIARAARGIRRRERAAEHRRRCASPRTGSASPIRRGSAPVPGRR